MTWIEVDETKIQARLTAMPAKVYGALVRKVTTLRLMLEAKIKGKLSDDVLHVRSGNLRRSIFSETLEQATSVVGRAASSGDVKYAAIQEFGGSTPAHDIVPVKAQALAFMMGGKQVFASIVHHPGSNIPARSYMRSSLGEMADQIVAGLKEAAGEGVRQ